MPENPYPDGSGMRLNTGHMTMQYQLHEAWDEGFAAERARILALLDEPRAYRLALAAHREREKEASDA